MAASEHATDDHLDRFENADAAKQYVKERKEDLAADREEVVELFGAAAELFNDRVLDTFTLERHDVEIEFYRPVDAQNTDLSALEADDPKLADRLRAGSRYLDEFDAAQRELLQAIGSDTADLTPEDIHTDAVEGTEVMRKALSAFAVDESFRDPRVWKKIFRNDGQIREVYEEFVAEGNEETVQEQRAVLQNMMLSGSDSTN